MSSILIIGGNGKVARFLTNLLLQNGDTVHSVIRNPAQVDDLTSLGVKPIVQPIEDSSVDDFAKVITDVKPTAVVWCAAAGFGQKDRVQAVDYEGAVKIADAIAKAADEVGTSRRYIMISSADLRDRENKPVPHWYTEADKTMGDRVWSVAGLHLQAKYLADKSLVEENDRRKLDYTIVRPGGLGKEAGVGTIAAGHVSLLKMISREDVAAVAAACLKNDRTIGLAFDAAGGDIKITEAVAKVAEDRVDTFEGYH